MGSSCKFNIWTGLVLVILASGCHTTKEVETVASQPQAAQLPVKPYKITFRLLMGRSDSEFQYTIGAIPTMVVAGPQWERTVTAYGGQRVAATYSNPKISDTTHSFEVLIDGERAVGGFVTQPFAVWELPELPLPSGFAKPTPSAADRQAEKDNESAAQEYAEDKARREQIKSEDKQRNEQRRIDRNQFDVRSALREIDDLQTKRAGLIRGLASTRSPDELQREINEIDEEIAKKRRSIGVIVQMP